VSRALAGYAEVKEETRTRVRAAAQSLGYAPNPAARRLAMGKAGAVGVVLPLPIGRFADPFFSELLVGIGERLRRDDLDLIVTAAPAGAEELRAYRHLVEGRRVDGVIVARTRCRDARIDYLLERGFPFVAHGRTDGDCTFSYLDLDSAAAFRQAVARLVEFGHRRIALINGPAELYLSRLRQSGYAAGLADAGIGVDPLLAAEGDLGERSGLVAAARLLDLPDPPTAILASNDPMAIGALRAVRQAGLRVPGDVSVIGYDDLPMAGFTEPPLTTFAQPVRDTGGELVDLLLAQLRGDAAEPAHIVRQPVLMVRASDGPAPGTAKRPMMRNHKREGGVDVQDQTMA
jgi:LacI family transcriptional regulator